jgi:CHAT domain-containing protein
MIESERVGVRSKEYSISWFEDKVNAYHSFISFLVRDPDRVIDDSGFRDMGATFKEAAFRMSESCRARMLNDLLRKRKPLPKDGKTATILDELHRLGVRLEKLHERRESLKNDMAGAAPEIEAINAEIAGIQRRKNIMEAELDRTELLRLASQSTILDLPQIRKLLDPGCAFLEYVVMDDETLIFAVSRDSLRLYRIPLKSRGGMRYPDTYEEQERWARRARPDRSMGLEGLVHFYRFPMTHYPSPARQETWTEHQKAGRELRGLLLPGQLLEHLTEQKVSHLIIVPDGILNYLPFSSLILSEESAGDYNLEFLINRYSLSFLPSASVLGILREQKEQRRRNRSPRNDLLAFADPVFGGNDERAKGAAEEAGNNGRIALGRLPETRDEAENVAELFPKEKTCILTGFDADERHLREGATCEYRYLLFATHGLIDEDNPPLSCIALSIADPTKPGAQRASPFLTMDKIFGIDLNADLVVLSACETALGKVSRGEGMLGLPLAFFYAGTPSLLASIWKVPSEATAQLSKEFFASLISGNNKAEALRAAQLSLMSRKTFTRSYAHPFFWSAFIVDGDWR